MSAFLAGPRLTPLPVTYPEGAACLEWSLPALDVRRVLGVSAKELSGRVVELNALPASENVKRALDGGPIRLGEAAGQALSADEGLVRAAWSWLQSNPHCALCELGACFGVSRRRIQQAFFAVLGLSPKQVRTLLRYERAFALLSASRLSLAAIAHETGFSDQSHMTRELKRFSGLTPQMARKALLTGH